MDFYDRLREIKVDDAEKDVLIAKCQENGWLRRGGYDWQDDPYMEEYPYSFVRTESLDDLRQFFTHGNWAIRQGALYHDLAFIQQVNGGDEWWTLKQTDDGWLAFESWSFELISDEPDRFSRAIASMEMATPEQCKSLSYMMESNDLAWKSGYANDVNWAGDEVRCRWFSAEDDRFRIDVYERPSYPGYTAEVFSKEERVMLCRETDIECALSATAISLAKFNEARLTEKSSPSKSLESNALASRVAAARDASKAMGEERSREEAQKQAR